MWGVSCSHFHESPYVADYLQYLDRHDASFDAKYSFKELKKSFNIKLHLPEGADTGEADDEVPVKGEWMDDDPSFSSKAPVPVKGESMEAIPDTDVKLSVQDFDKAKYKKAFPYGHETIGNSGEGLYCGFFAVIASMEAQYSTMRPPSVKELEVVRDSHQVQAWAKSLGFDEVMNFHVEFLAKIFEEWALTINPELSFRLGVYEKHQNGEVLPRLHLLPNDKALILWISGDLGPQGGHYEGMQSRNVDW